MKRFSKTLLILISVLLLNSCEKALDSGDPSTSPVAVFEDLWNAIDRNYALFSVKGIDWDSVYQQNKISVNDNLSSTELFKKCGDMLDVLKDGHVSLITPERIYAYENFFRAFPTNFNLPNIEKTYLNGQYKKLGPIIYKVVNEVGYIYYRSFRENISDAELNLFIDEMAATKGLIVDVRSNSGGSLTNVSKLFSRFINKKTLVKFELQKKGAGQDEFFDEEPHYISPAGVYYGKPIVVLTNRSCFSACNDFVLYMSYLPNVRLVGDQTGGGGAIPANYLLVNGWKLQYSSSMTLSPDHLPVENGIPPDFFASITPVQETQGRDPILEKAYDLLK